MVNGEPQRFQEPAGDAVVVDLIFYFSSPFCSSPFSSSLFFFFFTLLLLHSSSFCSSPLSPLLVHTALFTTSLVLHVQYEASREDSSASDEAESEHDDECAAELWSWGHTTSGPQHENNHHGLGYVQQVCWRVLGKRIELEQKGAMTIELRAWPLGSQQRT